jgi:hypothetical protein
VAKVKRTPGSGARQFLCLEMLWEPDGQQGRVTMLASLVGREDVADRSWRLSNGIPTQSQLNDIAHTVAKHVSDATVAFCGVQRQLEV